MISHRAWQLRFGSDPNIIGRTITVNRTEHVIVGVAPEEFRGHVGGLNEAAYQLWLPLSHHPRLNAAENTRFQRDANWGTHRRAPTPGTTLPQADAAVQSRRSRSRRTVPGDEPREGGRC